jgi:hypothetical protein
MNEEALDVLFSLAKRDGYQKSIEDFTLLMSENEKAVNRMFGLAKGDGYKKGIEDFKTLVGYGSNVAADPQKKNQNVSVIGGFLESLPPEEDLQSVSATSPSVASALTRGSQEVSPENQSQIDALVSQASDLEARRMVTDPYIYEQEMADINKQLDALGYLPQMAATPEQLETPEAQAKVKEASDRAKAARAVDGVAGAFEALEFGGTGGIEEGVRDQIVPKHVVPLSGDHSISLLDENEYPELGFYDINPQLATRGKGGGTASRYADRLSYGPLTPAVESILKTSDSKAQSLYQKSQEDVLESDEFKKFIESDVVSELINGKYEYSILSDKGFQLGLDIDQFIVDANEKMGLTGEDAIRRRDLFFSSEEDANYTAELVDKYLQGGYAYLNGDAVPEGERREAAMARLLQSLDGRSANEIDLERTKSSAPPMVRSAKGMIGSYVGSKLQERFDSEYKDDLFNYVNENIPSEIRDNENFLNAFDDHVRDAIGIGLNLSGDKKYNDAGFWENFQNRLDIGYADWFNWIFDFGAAIDDALGYDTSYQEETEANARAREEFRAGLTIREQSVSELLEAGDYYGVSAEIGNTVVESAPQIVGALVFRNPVVGATVTGAISAETTYGDISIDERFDGMDTFEKFIYSAEAGATEAFTQRILGGIAKGTTPSISKTLSKRVDDLTKRTFDQTRAQFLTRAATGYALKTGYAGSAEMLGEMTTEALNYANEIAATGEEFSMKDFKDRMILAAGAGGMMGAGLAPVGFVAQRSRNASNAADERVMLYKDDIATSEISAIDKKLSANAKAVQSGSDPIMTDSEVREATTRKQKLESERNQRTKAKQLELEYFYRMMQYRHPDQFRELEEKKNEISMLVARSRRDGATKEEIDAYKARIDQRMAEIQEIKSLYRNEDLSLSTKEAAQYSADYSGDSVSRLEESLEGMKASLEAMEAKLEAGRDVIDAEGDAGFDIEAQEQKVKERREQISDLENQIIQYKEAATNLAQALAEGNDADIKTANEELRSAASQTAYALSDLAALETEQQIEQSLNDIESDLNNLGDADAAPAVDEQQQVDDVLAEVEEGNGKITIEKGFLNEDQLLMIPEELRLEYANIINDVQKLSQADRVIVVSPETAAKMGMGDTVGMVSADGKAIYVNPEAAVGDTKKSFKSHMIEEVLHTHVTNQWRGLKTEEKLSLLNEAYKLFPDSLQRMKEKLAQYGDTGVLVFNEDTNQFELGKNFNPDNDASVEKLSELTEELTFEPLLKYAEKSTPDPDQSLLGKLKDFFNKLIGKSDSFQITGSEDLRSLAQGFKNAYAGKQVKVDLKGEQKAADGATPRKSKVEKKIESNSDFILNENGEVELFFSEKNYEGISRIKSVTAKNPVHAGHLINKITNGGTNPRVSAFYQSVKTDSGFQDTYVDVDSVIKNRFRKPRRSKASGQDFFLGKKMRATERVDAAYDQGLISRPERNRMLSNLNTLERLYNGAGRYTAKGTNIESPKFKRADALLDQFESKSAAFFAKRAKAKGTTFFFGPDSRTTRKSQAALDKASLTTDPVAIGEFNEALAELLCGNKVKTCKAYTAITDSQRLQYLVFSEYPELKDPTLTSEQRTEIGTAALIDAMAMQQSLDGWLDTYYGGKNPLDFYKDTNAAVQDLFKRAVMTGQIGKMVETNADSFAFVTNLMLAITSQVNTAQRNVLGAARLSFEAHKEMANSSQQTDSGIIAGRGLVSPAVIDELMRLRKGDKAQGTAAAVSPVAREEVAGNLEKVNLLFSGESIVGSDGKTYKFPKSVLKTDPDAGIVVDSESAFEYLNERDPKTGMYNAQMIFGPKVGAFFLNLGGNLDVVTLDTHVLRSLATYRGEWNMFDTEIDRVIGTFLRGDKSSLTAEENRLASKAIVLAGMEGQAAIDPNEVIQKLIEIGAKKDEGLPYRQRSEETKIAESLIYIDAKDINLDSSRRAELEKMIVGLADALTARNGEDGRVVKPAEAMQLIFADHQIFTFGKVNSSKYTPFSTAIEQVIEDKSFFTAGFRESMEMAAEAMYDGAYSGFQIQRKSEAQGQMTERIELAAADSVFGLKPADVGQAATGNKIVAEDSNTYRSRTKPKGAKKSNTKVLTDVNLNVNVLKSEASLTSIQEGIFDIQGKEQEVKPSDVSYDGVMAVFKPDNAAAFTDVEGRPIKSASEATIIETDSGVPMVLLRGEIEYLDVQSVSVPRRSRASRGNVDPEIRQDAIDTVAALAEANGTPVDVAASVGRMTNAEAVELVNSEQGQKASSLRRSRRAEDKIRGTVDRTVGKFSSPTRAKILANKKSYFKPQSLAEKRAELDGMTDDQLVQELSDFGLERASKGDDPTQVFKKEDSFAVLAGIERINRAINNGADQDAIAIMEELAAMGTTAGRILRYLQELKHIDPDFLYKQLRLQIDNSGALLSDAQDSKLKAMTNAFNAAKDAYIEAREKAANLGTKEAEAELRRADKSFAIVKRDLNAFMNSMVPGAWARIIQQNIQGNLLVVKSHVVNVGTNLFRALGFIAYNTMAHPIERIINKLGGESKNKRSYSLMAYIDGIRYARKSGRILKEDILEGLDPDRRSEWRMERGLSPIQALLKLFGRGDTPIYADNIRGRAKTVDNVLKTAFQAILGIPANINFKLLTAGDIPFRMFGEGVALAEMGRARGLRGEALRQFMMFPPKEAALEAQKEGARLTFQEETTIGETAKGVINSSVKFIGGAMNKIPGFGRGKFFDGEAFVRFIFRAANLPYLDTPAAIANEVLTFSLPPYAVARMLKDARAGDSRKASQHLAKAILGGVTIQAALYMIKHGLMTGATDWEDDEERNIRGGTFHAQAINVTKLRRHINGEDDGKYHKDDLTIQYPRLGVIGAILTSVAASTNKEELKNRDLGSFGGAELIRKSLGVDASSATSAMLDQTFMQGMEGLLKALASNNEKQQESAVARYFGTMFNAVSASVLPNQFASLTRYNSEYAPVANIDKDATWEEQTVQRIEHTLKLRTFNTEGMLPRIDIKGNPIPSTPEGSNPIVYHFFDPTKASQGSGDPVDLALYSLYEDTGVFHTVYSHRKIYQDVKNKIPSFPRGRKGKVAVALAENETGRKYTFFNDPDFYSESYRRLLPEDRIEIAKALNSSKHRDLTALIQTQEYISATPQVKLSMLDEIDESYKSALEMDGPRFRDYSIVVLDAFQNLYEEIYGEE